MILTCLVILAFLLFAILRELELGTEEAPGRFGRCPGCSQVVEDDWIVCPHCRVFLREDCRACHQSRFLAYPFCPHCGDGAVP